MNNAEKELSEKLGEFYIPLEKRNDKNLLIDTINRFINKYPNLNPDGRFLYSKGDPIYKYAEQNGLMILDYRMFAKKLGKLKKSWSGYNIAICYNKTNDTKVIILDRGNTTINELSSRYELVTIRNIYKAFVIDIIDHSIILRERKELSNDIRDYFARDGFYVKTKTNGLIITKYNSFSLDDITFKLTYNYDIFELNLLASTANGCYGYTNMRNSILGQHQIIDFIKTDKSVYVHTKEELEEMIEGHYQIAFESLKSNKGRALSFFNTTE